jgi:spore maturation protein CgeB
MSFKIAFFGSSLVSAYWNGAATYYRGIIKALFERGHQITFFEPDAYDRQKNRDIEDPHYAKVVVYENNEESLYKVLSQTDSYDIIIKASGVGVFDQLLEAEVINVKKPDQLSIFWDVDAPATLDRVQGNPSDPFNALIPKYDFICTYGGGDPVVSAYKKLKANDCYPIYNALDPSTHFPVKPEPAFIADLSFLGNRLPDREARVEEFFLHPASKLLGKTFLLGGSGWGDKKLTPNVHFIGHVFTHSHNAFNCSPKAVLNIARDSMARYGYSPATRVFEAAGAGACIITDYWQGIEHFFEPDKEILVAHDGIDVIEILKNLSNLKSAEIGNAAYQKVLAVHTYAHRADQFEKIFFDKMNIKSVTA